MQGAGLRSIPSSFCMDFLYDFPSIGLWLRNTEFWTRKAPCTKPYCSMPFDPAAAICPYLRRESLLLQQGHPGPTRSPSNTLAWVRNRPQLLQSSCQNDLNSPVTNSPPIRHETNFQCRCARAGIPGTPSSFMVIAPKRTASAGCLKGESPSWFPG
jgi:hypothetical protein